MERITTELIEETRNFIQEVFAHDTTGHDFYHVERVVLNAKKISVAENLDEDTKNLVILTAWLHDLGDYKLHNGIDQSEKLISDYLISKELSTEIIQQVITIVSEVSFSKGLKTSSLAAEIVQDADRLDAIGAIGIARCFAYGGNKNRPLYSPNTPKEKDNSSIQHFYDKLLLLKDKMNTPTGQQIAIERHEFMKAFLAQFYNEVE